MSYNVLLATPDPALRERLRAQFAELPDVHLFGVAVSSAEVSTMLAAAENLHCLLLHDDLGPLPTADLIRDVTQQQPQLAVILIVADTTADVLTSAMEAGARGVIGEQPSLEDLETRVSAAAEWSRTIRRHLDGHGAGLLPGHAGRTVAIAGGKGGTGTTTLAVHLALAVAAARRTVCLVDMDLQAGDIPTYLDITHRRSIVDLTDAADDLNPTVLADTLYAHRLGPHVLLAPQDGERGEDLTGAATRQILGSLRSRYDVVIVDCGSHVTEASAMAVEMADRVIVTTTGDTPSLRGTKRLVELWERLQARKRDDLAVVLTRHRRQNEIQPEFARKVLNLNLLPTPVPDAAKALEPAANTGTPTEVDDAAFGRAIGRLVHDAGLFTSPAETPVDLVNAPAQHGRGRRSRRHGRGSGRESGQATIEFVGLLPYILFIVLFLWEALVIGMGMINASHAANEGARAAAVGQSHDKVAEAAKKRMSGDWSDRTAVAYRPGDDQVTVSVRIPVFWPKLDSPWSMTASAEVVHE